MTHNNCGHDEESEAYLLCQAVQVVRDVCTVGRAARQRAGVKIRVPMRTAYITVPHPADANYLFLFQDDVRSELNVEKVEVDVAGEVSVDFSWVLTPDLEIKWLVRELIHFIQSKRRNMGYEVGDVANLQLWAEDPLYTVLRRQRKTIEEETQSHISVAIMDDGESALLCKYRIRVEAGRER